MTEVCSLRSKKLVLVGMDVWGEITSSKKARMTCVINKHKLKNKFLPTKIISCVASTQEMT